MRILQSVAVSCFLGGLALLVFAVMFGGDDADPGGSIPPVFDLRDPSTPQPQTPTSASNTASATAVPTSPPFDGRVARIVAPSVGLDHAIEEIGLVENQLDVPKDGVGKVGWYSIYDKPGHWKNSVFAAHVNFNKKDGPFARLKEIQRLAEISIVMEDGPTYVYEVVAFNRYDQDTIPTGDLIAASTRPEGEEWITLITCGGQFVPDPGSEFGHYLQRDVVIARLVE